MASNTCPSGQMYPTQTYSYPQPQPLGTTTYGFPTIYGGNTLDHLPHAPSPCFPQPISHISLPMQQNYLNFQTIPQPLNQAVRIDQPKPFWMDDFSYDTSLVDINNNQKFQNTKSSKAKGGKRKKFQQSRNVYVKKSKKYYRKLKRAIKRGRINFQNLDQQGEGSVMRSPSKVADGKDEMDSGNGDEVEKDFDENNDNCDDVTADNCDDVTVDNCDDITVDNDDVTVDNQSATLIYKNHPMNKNHKTSQCTICNQYFPTFASKFAADHQVTVHQKHVRTSWCAVCKEFFRNYPEMINHFVNDHNMRRPYKCPQCGIVTKYVKKLHKHYLKEHVDETEKRRMNVRLVKPSHKILCSFCDQVFPNAEKLSMHKCRTLCKDKKK